MQVTELDHLVLTVKDIQVTSLFYERVLGMLRIGFGSGRAALGFGTQKINLQQEGKELVPKARFPKPGAADLCFITTTPLDQAMQHVKTQGVQVIAGPVERQGAGGILRSFYFRDPDGNLLEVANRV